MNLLIKKELKELIYKLKILCREHDCTEQINFLKNQYSLTDVVDKYGNTILYYICETLNAENMITYALDTKQYLTEINSYWHYNRSLFDHFITTRNIKYLKLIIKYNDGSLINGVRIWEQNDTIINLLCFSDKHTRYINFFKNTPKFKLLKLINLILSFSHNNCDIRNDKNELPIFNLLRNKKTFFEEQLRSTFENICILMLTKMMIFNEKEMDTINNLEKGQCCELWSTCWDKLGCINQEEENELLELLKDHNVVIEHYYKLEKQFEEQYNLLQTKK